MIVPPVKGAILEGRQSAVICLQFDTSPQRARGLGGGQRLAFIFELKTGD
jgi:hypothetical protein